MDINDLRALATVFTTVAFGAVCFWAYSGKNKQRFDEAANLPFADEPDAEQERIKGEQK
ncbi:MAG: cytochrome c oxidase cbb3-type subunit 4 [Reinekea sp.]|jgi:cytochrome c oxidase cbb3-type subunit 4|nr:cbb3-type cytochrome c oxidase subunit 3 [Reinekea forsetii]|tara:strand:+ start:1007 stop:1183 length:177 start_codon:yes stop_codon:yes gene_type:complete